MAYLVVAPTIVVPVGFLPTLEGNAELDGSAEAGCFGQSDVEGERVRISSAICVVHILAADIPETPPGVKGDADVHLLLVADVPDLDGP